MMQHPQTYLSQSICKNPHQTKIQPQDIQYKVVPGNVYNYSNNPTDIQRGYQLNNPSNHIQNQYADLNVQGLNQRPLVQKPKQESSWLDFFSWLNH